MTDVIGMPLDTGDYSDNELDYHTGLETYDIMWKSCKHHSNS